MWLTLKVGYLNMEYSRALFKIDSDSSLPIKEQIKLLIGKDLFKLGDTLPSTNQRVDVI